MINWIKTFYNNIESCILNIRWSSDIFKPKRRVRQGCLLSPYLFNLYVELQTEKNKKHQIKDIKGISVNQNEIKISQYAEDRTLDGSKKFLTLS